MTADEILDGILRREGGFRAAVKRPDGTIDPCTNHGITAPVLGEWRKLGRPATRAEVRALTEAEARAIYQQRYIDGPGFTPAAIPFEPLRAQVIDFGINSGQALATRWLQRVCRVAVTGVMDKATITWLHEHRGYLWLVNDALVAVRARMVDDLVDDGHMRPIDEEGVESRALSFVVTHS